MIGKIKFFNPYRRFGFIVPDGKTYKDKCDVFFYEDKFEGGIKGTVEEGAEVEYEPIPTDPGKAMSVRFTGRRYAPVSEFPKKGGGTHGD